MKKIARVNDVPEGKSLIVYLPTGQEIALFNVQGEIFALGNECPHMGGPLGEGEITIEGSKKCVTCPWHGWDFDLTTGTCENVPHERAKRIPIVIHNGEIYLREEGQDIQ